MRPIKFRAWNIDKSEMYNVGHWTINMLNDNLLIIMQFTGLCDQSHTEIYEGDILRHFCNTYRAGMDDPRGWTFVVSYEGGCFGERGAVKSMHVPEDLKFDPFYHKDCGVDDFLNTQVIGNIYENPELLK